MQLGQSVLCSLSLVFASRTGPTLLFRDDMDAAV